MATYTTLYGNEVESPTLPLTQVYKATHNGTERLPYMNRSFISFSYGSKKNSSGVEVPVFIEDFNLIATTSGDRMQRDAYASFEDLTSTYDTIPGQFYWGTYFHTNSLNFTLVSDGITQRELDDFKKWFRAGSIRELILAEHPNRAILARIANPPRLNLLPFEEKVKVPFIVGGNVEGEEASEITYETSTTLYRGEIELEFVMDEPFWYAKQNILGHQNTTQGYYEEQWIDANGKLTSIKESEDALKIIYEDHIPLGSTTKIDVFLGGDIYASVKYELWSQIVQPINKEEYIDGIQYIGGSQKETEQMRSAYWPINLTGEVEGSTPEEMPAEEPATGGDNTGGEDDIPVEDPAPDTDEPGTSGTPTEEPVVDDEVLTEPDNSSGDNGDSGSSDSGNSGEDSGSTTPVVEKAEYYRGAVIAFTKEGSSEYLGGKIGGAQLLGSSAPVKGISLPMSEKANLYYAGTAPAPVKLRFTLAPAMSWYDTTGSGNAYYIVTPKNKHSDGTAYNTITLESSEKHEFKFTLPTFWLSYNQVIEIFDNPSILAQGLGWLTVREAIRNTVRHPVIRAWANMLINKYDHKGGSSIIPSDDELPAIRGDLERGMQMLLLDKDKQPFPASFMFDGKTGLAIGTFTYRSMEGVNVGEYDQNNDTSLENAINSSVVAQVTHTVTDEETGETTTTTEQQVINENYTLTQEENVGDMVKSSYLILDERNVLDRYYQVQAWEEAHPDYAYKITHDVDSGLQDLHFEFKNMYL